MTTADQQMEALDRARNGESWTNYATIFAGFIEKGIPEPDIRPRENVFTFNAWKALGRSVKRGEHGVRVVTFIERTVTEPDPATGQQVERSVRSPHTTGLSHYPNGTDRRALNSQPRLSHSAPVGMGKRARQISVS
jgi:hypothetical protein